MKFIVYKKYYTKFFNNFETKNIIDPKYENDFYNIYIIKLLFATYDKKLYQEIIKHNQKYIPNTLPKDDILYLFSENTIKNKIKYIIDKCELL